MMIYILEDTHSKGLSSHYFVLKHLSELSCVKESGVSPGHGVVESILGTELGLLDAKLGFFF